MLLPREQSPWNCGYYLGAIALRALNKAPKERADLLALQERMSSIIQRPVSPTQVITAAAWLYLLGVIELDDHGMVVKCS
jgi:hypothetical protein